MTLNNKNSVKLTDYQVESLLLVDSKIQKAIDAILSVFKRYYPTGFSFPLKLDDLKNQNNSITVLLTESQINILSQISSSIQDAFNKVFLLYESYYPTITSVSAFNGGDDLMIVTTPTNFFFSDFLLCDDIEDELIEKGIPYKTVFHDDKGVIFTLDQMSQMYKYFKEYYSDRRPPDKESIYIFENKRGKKFYQTFEFKSKNLSISLPLYS